MRSFWLRGVCRRRSAVSTAARREGRSTAHLPPRVSRRGGSLPSGAWQAAGTRSRRRRFTARLADKRGQAGATDAATATWQPLGPTAVLTPIRAGHRPRFRAGARSLGRHRQPALRGHHRRRRLGGAECGRLRRHRCIVFTPLTDSVAALERRDGRIDQHRRALTVQPGGTGVILAGTGDPNDALDSYYGAGILRSTDGGNTWSLIPQTSDAERAGHARTSLYRRGFCRFCLEHGQSATGRGRGFAGLRRHAGGCRRSRARATRGCTTPPTAAPPGIWPPSPTAAATDVQGPIDAVRRRPTAMPPHRWCGTRCGSCLLRRCAITATTSRPTASPGRGMAAQPGAGLTDAALPHQSGQHGLDRLPHLSRRAGGESANRRYLCLDGGRQQPGPGAVAGSVRDQRAAAAATRRSPSPSNGARRRSKRARSRARRPSRTATTTWRWPRCRRARTRCCWPAHNDLWKCSLAMGCAWRNTTNCDHLHERAGGRVTSTRWRGTRPIRWRFLSATTAGCGARRTPSARPGRCAPRPTPRTFRI